MKQGSSEAIINSASNRDWIFYLNRLYCNITPTKGVPFGIAVNELESGDSTTRHSHEAVELFLVTKGQVKVIIDEIIHVLNEGDSCFVPTMIEHNLINASLCHIAEFVCIWWPQEPQKANKSIDILTCDTA